MYPIKPTAGFEFTDPYEKAKQDMLTAIHSMQVLSPVQREMLAKELFGASNVAAVLRLMRNLFHKY